MEWAAVDGSSGVSVVGGRADMAGQKDGGRKGMNKNTNWREPYMKGKFDL